VGDAIRSTPPSADARKAIFASGQRHRVGHPGSLLRARPDGRSSRHRPRAATAERSDKRRPPIGSEEVPARPERVPLVLGLEALDRLLDFLRGLRAKAAGQGGQPS